MNELFLAHRWMLYVLVPLFVLWVLAFVFLPWLAHRRRKAAAVKFSNISNLSRLRPSKTLVIRRLFQGLRLATVALLQRCEFSHRSDKIKFVNLYTLFWHCSTAQIACDEMLSEGALVRQQGT